MRTSFSDLFDDFVSLVYPRYCLACHDALVKGEETICTRCIHELPRTNFHLQRENPVFKRLFGRIPVNFAVAFLHFTKGGRVQQLLHALKYSNHPEAGRIIGRVYGEELLRNGYRNHIDIVIPIPLHASKYRVRGYNQSEEFARGLARALDVQCAANAVIRTTRTDTQTRKSKLKRWENVKEVFEVFKHENVVGKKILLVDDVITTGATLEACGHVLVEAGCAQLNVAGIAYAHE